MPVPVTVVRTVRNLGPFFLQARRGNETTVAVRLSGGKTRSPMAFAGWQADTGRNASAVRSCHDHADKPARPQNQL